MLNIGIGVDPRRLAGERIQAVHALKELTLMGLDNVHIAV